MKSLWLVATCFFSGTLLFAQQKPEKNPYYELQTAITQFASSASVRQASFGICVREAETGEIVASSNPDLLLVPASSLKVLTTFPTLKVLGKDFRFATALLACGHILSGGVLNGNLLIKCSGDPTLGSNRFASTQPDSLLSLWALAVKNAGINRITGRIIIDSALFSGIAFCPDWLLEDAGNYYGASVFRFNFRENSLSVVFAPGKRIGDKAPIIRTVPALAASVFSIQNQVTTAEANSGDRVVFYSMPGCNQIFATGTLPVGKSEFTAKASIPDPKALFVSELTEALLRKGISVENSMTSDSIQKPERLLIKTISPPLLEIIRQTHYKSINLYAEALIRTLTPCGSLDSALEAVSDFWEKMGVPENGLQMKDGSGLSRTNLVTASAMSLALCKIKSDPAFEEFFETLAVGGESGSVGTLFKGTLAQKNLRAKSGYMSGVRAYAGFVKNRAGVLLAFTIIVNNYSGTPANMKSQLEKIMVKIAESGSVN